MPFLSNPGQKRRITISYPAELYDKLVDGLAYRFGWNENGVPAASAQAKAHRTFDATTGHWKPTREEYAKERALAMVWLEAMQGYAARQAQDAQKQVQQAFQGTLEEAQQGGYISVNSEAVTP